MTHIVTEQLPAGEFYVGDLCYVLHAEWDEVCDLLFAGRDDHGCNQGLFTLKDGRKFVMFNTAHGDGMYFDNRGRQYSVDAGSIGCILSSDIDLEHEDNDTDGGQIYKFTQAFNCECEDGMMRFSNLQIDTNPVYEEYEEDNDCDD